jgi:hypothetical protein
VPAEHATTVSGRASDLHTLADATVQDVAAAARGRRMRRLAIGLMVVFVAAGLLGLLGYRDGTVRSTSGPYELEVRYPALTRAGLPSNWELTLVRTDGEPLTGEIAVRTTAGYFDLFDENGLVPTPDSEWQDREELVWTFAPGPDDTELLVHYDARLQPNRRGWWTAETTVLVDDTPVASVEYRTVAVP